MLLLPSCAANGGTATSTTPSATKTTAAPTTSAVASPVPGPSPRTEKWIDLNVGDCLSDPPPTDPSAVFVTVVDCADAHAAQVYLRAPVEVNAAIADVADRKCAQALTQYTRGASGGTAFATTYLIDSNQDRTSDNPLPSTVICMLTATNGQPLTGSARP